ncbi:MAG: alpha/beta fold hydrolase [Salinibacter sp.]
MRRPLTTCLLLLVSLCVALGTSPATAQKATSDDVIVGAGNMSPPSVEYQGELPPLIDRQTFFGDPKRTGAQISPDGEHVSFIKPYKGVMNVWVKGVDESFDAAEPVTADTTRPVRSYFWTQDSERILYRQDKGGNENFHIYAVDPDSEKETELGVPPAEDLTPYEKVQARIFAVPEATPGVIVVGLNDRNPQYHDLYRIDLETGERELIFKNTEGYGSYTFDHKGRFRLATRQTDSGGTEIQRVDITTQDTTFTTVYACSVDESCGVTRFHKDNERVYLQTNKGEDVDLQQLRLLNVQTKESELVAKDPEGAVDFGGTVFNDRTEKLVATAYVGERKRVYPKTESFEQTYQTLTQKLPDGELSLQSSTEDFQTHLVSVSRDVNPGATYLFDAERGTVEKLYESRPELPTQHLAEMKPITYEARDGLTIPAYLTVPKGVEAKNLPTVMFIHGGPWSRDTWGYDAFAQFLANRGYAVLQPNYRGSSGYGQSFLHAGDEEWGTGAMQHDITDGVKYLIDKGIADPDRVGIFGGSYGGYATLAGVTFTPDLYAAGVPYVAPSNLITLIESFPAYWKPYLEGTWYERVGNPNNPKDRKRLKRQSPLFKAEQITAPLMVVHGANDPRVKQQESDQIVATLDQQGHPVEYLVAPDEGHGFSNEDNRLALSTAMEKFLAEHLGGRYQKSATDRIRTRLNEITVNPDSVTMPDTTATAKAKPDAPSGVAMMDGSKLEAATLSYDATMKMRGKSFDLSSTRTLRSTTTSGTKTWTVVGKTETPRATVTDSLIMDRSTLRPVSRHQRGPLTMDVTYTDTSASGTVKVRGRSTSISKTFDRPTLAGGSHDLIALGTMPLKPGFSTSLQVFSPRQQTVRTANFEVTGTKTVTTPAGSFEAYVVDVTVGDDKVTGTVHLRKTAPHHVVKAKLDVSTPRGTRTIRQTLSKMSTSTSGSGTR